MKLKPSPAVLIACAALFFALGGAGLAASGTPTTHTVMQTKNLPGRSSRLLVAACGYGKPIGGGFQGPIPGFVVSGSYPVPSIPFTQTEPRGWGVQASNRTHSTLRVTVWAVCQA